MAHANEETSARIKKALKAGNVHYADDVGLLSQPSGPVEIKSLYIWGPYSREEEGRVFGTNGGFEIAWRKPGCGFGGLAFVVSLDGVLECHSETMGPEFVKEVLSAFVDSAKFTEVSDD